MFLPATLLALTQKYQIWVSKGTPSFTTTYFSYFGAILFLSSGVLLILSLMGRTKFQKQAIVLISMSFFVLSVLTDYSNFHITLSQTQNSLKWDAVNSLMKTKDFKSLRPKSTIYAPSILNRVTYDSYWTNFIQVVTKKNHIVVNNDLSFRKLFLEKGSKLENMYYLDFQGQAKDPNYALTFCKVASLQFIRKKAVFGCNRVIIFTHSKYRQFNLLFINQKTKHLQIDGTRFLNLKGTIVIPISKKFRGNDLLKTEVLGRGLNPSMITVSFFENQNIIRDAILRGT
jgi:hypothetical protein